MATIRLETDGHEVLAIFGGEDSYVSPNWYPGKAAHHKALPTRNFRVVHVHRRISFHHDEKAKRAVVGRLTNPLRARREWRRRLEDGLCAGRPDHLPPHPG